MEDMNQLEHYRMITVTVLSPIFGYLTPTEGFVEALVLMFAFNILAGMRADGISIYRCKNFSLKKFQKSIIELCLYLFVIELIYCIMFTMGDKEVGLMVVKSVTWVFNYVYLQNAFRNLIVAYPANMGLRIIYHVIRFEFARALPSHLQPLIERIEKEINDKKEEEKQC